MSFNSYDKSSKPKVANEDLEQAKFLKTVEEKIAVRVGNETGSPLHVKTKELVQGVDYDLITATYPSSVSEKYTYTLSAAVILVVDVVYTNVTKRDILTVAFS